MTDSDSSTGLPVVGRVARRLRILRTVVVTTALLALAACDQPMTTAKLMSSAKATIRPCSGLAEFTILQIVGSNTAPISNWECGVSDMTPKEIARSIDLEWVDTGTKSGDDTVLIGTSVDPKNVDRAAGKGVGHLVLLRPLIPLLETRSTVTAGSEVIILEVTVKR